MDILPLSLMHGGSRFPLYTARIVTISFFSICDITGWCGMGV